MPLSNPCDAWTDLLYDKNNRGAIYQHFTDNQASLLDHLSYCADCQIMLGSLDLTDFDDTYDFDPENLESMDSMQFSKFIRILYRAAQKHFTYDKNDDGGFGTD